MTLSSLKIHLALAFSLAASQVWAAETPAVEIAAAERAVATARATQPRGDAADLLARAGAQLAEARALMARRKARDAAALAQLAAANADLAGAQARRDAARDEVESKSARNADLRRRLLVNRGNG